MELMLDGEEAYNGFRRVIESANVIMATYADDLLGDTQARPGALTHPGSSWPWHCSGSRLRCAICGLELLPHRGPSWTL